MSGTELKQRLAAILAADVTGYLRLVAVDERSTMTALDTGRYDEAVSQYWRALQAAAARDLVVSPYRYFPRRRRAHRRSRRGNGAAAEDLSRLHGFEIH